MTPLRRLRRAAIDVEPLRHAAFRRLWLGNSLGFVGFQLTAVAVPVQVYELTGSSFWVGMLGLVGLVPLVMFGLWGGAVADAVDRGQRLTGRRRVVPLTGVIEERVIDARHGDHHHGEDR